MRRKDCAAIARIRELEKKAEACRRRTDWLAHRLRLLNDIDEAPTSEKAKARLAELIAWDKTPPPGISRCDDESYYENARRVIGYRFEAA